MNPFFLKSKGKVRSFKAILLIYAVIPLTKLLCLLQQQQVVELLSIL